VPKKMALAASRPKPNLRVRRIKTQMRPSMGNSKARKMTVPRLSLRFIPRKKSTKNVAKPAQKASLARRRLGLASEAGADDLLEIKLMND